jgi:hypothetical protein
MSNMRIALFTPFSPEIGGGSVQLRSHLKQMTDLDVEWYYLSPEPVSGEHLNWIGQPLSAWQFSADLCARARLPGSKSAVKNIVANLRADRYWVVGHYEGISVADELLSMGKPVHLTVHDEPLAMLIRSRRYRLLWPLMSSTFSRVLRGATSVDVTSTAMRDYFQQNYGVHCFALYKYLPELPDLVSRAEPNFLTVGHIGSLYHPAPFRQFVLACRTLAEVQKRTLKIVRIGSSPEMDKIAAEDLAIFENHGELLEKDALPVLAGCNFVYAMYPDGTRFKGFRRTSLPIKLSTYIQAQRPVFAHTPSDSGLARLVAQFGVGKVCSSEDRLIIQQAVQELLNSQITREDFEALRLDLMGPGQIQQLRSALLRS